MQYPSTCVQRNLPPLTAIFIQHAESWTINPLEDFYCALNTLENNLLRGVYSSQILFKDVGFSISFKIRLIHPSGKNIYCQI